MDYTRWMAAGMAMFLGFIPAALQGQAPPAQAPPGQAQPPRLEVAPERPTVVAMVNGDPITDREVRMGVHNRLQGQQVDPRAAQQVQRQVLEGLIDSRLVEQFAVENGPDVEPREVTEVIKRFEQQLTAQRLTLDQFLNENGFTADSFQTRVEGSLAWQKYQQENMTDENLARFFEANREQFPEAESLEQARPAVAGAYVGKMWQDVVSQMKPRAEIQLVEEPPAQRQPAAPRFQPQP